MIKRHEQPVLRATTDDLQRIVARDFAPKDRDWVFRTLDEYGTQPQEVEILRVKLDCLKLADGNTLKLKQIVNAAQVDYRDVMLTAEYPNVAGDANVDFSSPAAKRLIDSDWTQLMDWLHRT